MVLCRNSNLLAPTIRPFVEELFRSEIFSRHDLDLVSPVSGYTSLVCFENSGCVCDRFKLVLPFAGYSVVWEVIFDGTCPYAPPDFIFDDESFLCECELDAIPSLTAWDASDTKSLVQVISDLLKQYSKYQLQGVERNVGQYIRKWLDLENIEKDGVKVEVLNGSQKTGPYSTLSQQGNGSLQYGTTSVLVEVPIASEVLDLKIMHFSVQYTFKSHAHMYDEKITCSPELEGWLRPYSDKFTKKARWYLDIKALSEAISMIKKEITELFNKSVNDFLQRQELQLSTQHNIMSKNDLNPRMLEFDYNEFQFSSYLIREGRLFTVDFSKGYARGHLYSITPDCYGKLLREVTSKMLSNPKFDITDFLPRFDRLDS